MNYADPQGYLDNIIGSEWLSTTQLEDWTGVTPAEKCTRCLDVLRTSRTIIDICSDDNNQRLSNNNNNNKSYKSYVLLSTSN